MIGMACIETELSEVGTTLDVARDKIVDVLTYLRDDTSCLFEVLIDARGGAGLDAGSQPLVSA